MAQIEPRRERTRQGGRQRAARVALLLCTLALVPLAARALWWLPAIQERRVARLSLPALEALTRAEPANTVALTAYGHRLNEAGRFAEALTPLQSAAGQEPDNGRIRESWAIAQLAGGYLTGAFGQLTQFVRTHPADADGHRGLGRFYLTQRSYTRAVEELQQATALAPDDAEAWSLLAASHQGLEEPTAAYTAIQRAVRLRPSHVRDTLQAAILATETGHTEDAATHFAQATRLAPEDPIVAREWAQFLLNQSGSPERLVQAESLARRAQAALPDDHTALYLLGKVLLESNKTEEALTTLRAAAQKLPPGTMVSTQARNEPTQFLDPAPALSAAIASTRLGRSDEAKRWQDDYSRRQRFRALWSAQIDRARKTPTRESFQALAELHARRGDEIEVVRNLARARQSAGDAPPVLVASSRLLCQEGYPEQAVALARRAVLLAPRGPNSHEALGEAQLAAGRGHEAAVAFAHAAGWKTNHEADYKARLDAFYRQQALRPTPAQQLFAQARRIEQGAGGRATEEQNREMESLLSRAVALEPRNTDALRLLVTVLYARQQWDEALRYAEQLLGVSPEDALGLALRATLLLERPESSAPLALELLTRDLARALKEERLAAVYYAQGVLTLRQNNPKEALPILQQALELRRDTKTLERLEQTYRALGDMPNAAAMQSAARAEREKKP